MTLTIVTGLGYGDEGKGGTVDLLSRQGPTVVIRHNGGPQAGHNVVDGDGRHHEFAQFGSGTLAGAKTFLSRFMLVNPLNMVREADHLIELGEHDVWTRTFIDENAKIVTPYHVAYNRLLETARGEDRHGSCGQGVGAAMEQDVQDPTVTIVARQLCLASGLPYRLEQQRMYLMQCAARLGYVSGPHFEILCDSTVADYLAQRYRDWYKATRVVHPDFFRSWLKGEDYNLVFEGAQGVLLDEWCGFHPYTTWSTTTHENALILAKEVSSDPPIRLGVTRTYMTRHGPGPFVTEDNDLDFEEPHNHFGDWQRGVRQGHLDLSALRYAVDACGGVDGVVVTHLDRAKTWRWSDSYRLEVGREGDLDRQERMTRQLESTEPHYHKTDTDGLLETIEHWLGPIAITSRGPTAQDKTVLTGVSAR